MGEKTRQEYADRFYFQHGPCCSGCDHWHSLNSLVGECRKSAPISGTERFGMIGMESISAPVPAGHALTYRDHHCGGFKDEFDWQSLPAWYLRLVGFPTPTEAKPG